MSSNSNHQERRSLGIVIVVLSFFFLTFLVFVISLFSLFTGGSSDKDNIGVIEIKGTIAGVDRALHDIQKFSDDEDIKAILIRIDSPGGSVAASHELLEAIQAISKPVAISMGDMAASGGYYVACAGPKIFATPGTLTGSIGVISQVVELKDVIEFLKVKVHTMKTGALKDSGSPYRAFGDEDRTYFEMLGMDIFEQFVDLVSEARQLSREKVLEIADGRVVTGKQAHALGLIDELGGMHAALKYLSQEANIDGAYNLVYPKQPGSELLNFLFESGGAQVQEAIKAGAEALTNRHETFRYLYTGPH